MLDLARRLNRHGARFVLVGGYALAAHGLTRMTTDIDVAVDPHPDNSRRWIAALAELPDGVARELSREADPFQGDTLHAIRINDEFTVDVMPSVAGIPFDTLTTHAQTMMFDGEPVPVLDLAGLLLTKQGQRPKDQADAQLLREALRRLRVQEP
ncbi:MAG: nucleotidyl transferase AbiEii/AbiGii toxin family protein [Burkholderiales bacterium]